MVTEAANAAPTSVTHTTGAVSRPSDASSDARQVLGVAMLR